MHEGLGDAALKEGCKLSAGEHYTRAAVCYHFGKFLFVNDMVVYRSWGGQPRVNEVETTSNPLGPLQDVGPSLLSIK